MTDKEKAEEYVLRENVETMKYSECYGERVFFEKEVKKGYLDGLSDGRKELKKENEELKAHCKAVDEVNAKMKCCGNCRHRSEDGECEDTPWWDKCDKWELAE